LVAPAEGDFTQGFHETHFGIDLAAKKGNENTTKVFAVADGKVLKVKTKEIIEDEYQGYGNIVIIEHEDGVQTVYAHLEKVEVKEGNDVKKGQIIAMIGETNNNGKIMRVLHFEMVKDGKKINPLPFFTEEALKSLNIILPQVSIKNAN
jgi:murein DD-endopeptidase MepM/ murein hydrolase activator NlpD